MMNTYIKSLIVVFFTSTFAIVGDNSMAQSDATSSNSTDTQTDFDTSTSLTQQEEVDALAGLIADDTSLDELGLRLDRFDQILNKAIVVLEKLEIVREKQGLAQLLLARDNATADELAAIITEMSQGDTASFTDGDGAGVAYMEFDVSMIVFARDNGSRDSIGVRVDPTRVIETLHIGDGLFIGAQKLELLGVDTEDSVMNISVKLDGKPRKIVMGE